MEPNDPYCRIKGSGWILSEEGDYWYRDVGPGAPPPLQRRGQGGGVAAADAGAWIALPAASPPPPTPSSEEEGAFGPGAGDPVFTPALKLRFLDELSRHGNVRVAAARVGVSRSGLYLARRRDPLFARGWAEALCVARGHAEAVLAERALEGVEEAVFYHGEQIATRRRYDSRLLLAHLARLDALCAAFEPEVEERFDRTLGLVGELPEAEAMAGAESSEEAYDAALIDADRRRLSHKRSLAEAEAAAERWDAAAAALNGAVDAVLAEEAPPMEFKSLDCLTRRRGDAEGDWLAQRHKDTKSQREFAAPQAVRSSRRNRALKVEAASPRARPLRGFVASCEPREFPAHGTLSTVSIAPGKVVRRAGSPLGREGPVLGRSGLAAGAWAGSCGAADR